MNSFAASAIRGRVCLLEFAYCFKAEKKSSGEMQRLQMNQPSECGLISLPINLAFSFFHFSRTTVLTTPENTITCHNTLCWSLQNFAILHKHCLQFLLGVKMAPRETENNAYAKFWSDQQRVLWYVMVFSGVVNFQLHVCICLSINLSIRPSLRSCVPSLVRLPINLKWTESVGYWNEV